MCSEYGGENECNWGKDGPCIYAEAKCRLRTCAELENNPDLCRSWKDLCFFVESTKKCQPRMEECSGYKTMEECTNLNKK